MPVSDNTLLAGLDAGGTSFKCALATPQGVLVATHRTATSNPDATIAACCDWFECAAREQGATIGALGIGSFGPLDVDPQSLRYGTILNTPKSGWAGTDLRGLFAERIAVPVRIDTDVNAALAAEMAWGAAKGVSCAAYVTVGTGIGAGIFANGDFLGRPWHPEFGHIQLKRHPLDNAFKGLCPVHGDCLEGLASAPAFTVRHGAPERLAQDHAGWRVEAYYLAQACVSLSLSLRLERIVLGGGVMLAPHLLNLVHREYTDLIGGYLGESAEDVRTLITRPVLGDDAGILGGVSLAMTSQIE